MQTLAIPILSKRAGLLIGLQDKKGTNQLQNLTYFTFIFNTLSSTFSSNKTFKWQMKFSKIHRNKL